MKITIISDLHLGSDVSRTSEILEFLYQLNTEVLILNGDIFDNTNFNRLNKKHWNVVKRLRTIAKHTHIVWIKGNHDWDCEIIAHLVGAEFADDFIAGDALITHGDRFDSIIANRPILTRFADYCYRLIQKFDKWRGNDYYYSSYVKRKSKTLARAIKTTIARSIDFAKTYNYHTMILGHLHIAEDREIDGIRYVNTGAWTDNDFRYVEMEDGKIELKKFIPTQVPDRDKV